MEHGHYSISVPRHVAIIMDGNGRWAQKRGWGRGRGHHKGAKRVDELVTECCRLGVRYLTLYAFSTENWNRPSQEVFLLMGLLAQQLRAMDKKLRLNRVELAAKGSLHRLPKTVQTELSRVIRFTATPDPQLTLTLCLSYGGREEIATAARALAEKVARGEMSADAIDEAALGAAMYQPEVPDPDLLIRTGGEFRISNFLLWESAYTELYFTATLWPDFTAAALAEAFQEYGNRQRRFGMTPEQVLKPAERASPAPLL